MIVSLTVILLCQLLGEIVTHGFGWPLPGPVLGMLFLLVALSLRDRIRTKIPEFGRALDSTGKGLLAHLSLLFIPASVGVIQRLDVLAEYGVGLGVALVVSTFVTLVVTVVAFVVVSRLTGSSMEATGEGKVRD
ncbi:CidA/LrgA family protein [Microvirga lotononidis]|uniref:Putative effector of murein hydrolase LrgA n=1 Tax=Microvirga lotononidis TaxID=864069 RepID=I4YPQ4_9HYPH|nr:CidA/LrgA family protein [Microvirga lotononidis]EIM25946.1 putative effector of murein hydrolase LrgA [Microvirga lotononidis]WQO25859.1 CidA/LrgA family protein [Microvirga lotononidis]